MTLTNPENEHMAYLRIARAILLRAVMDAAGPYPLLAAEARRWLRNEGLFFCEALELDWRPLLKWLEQGCPAKPLKELIEYEEKRSGRKIESFRL